MIGIDLIRILNHLIIPSHLWSKLVYSIKRNIEKFQKKLKSLAKSSIIFYVRCQNHHSTFVYGPILMKICMNASIIKTQYMTWNVTFMLWRSFVILLLWPNCNLDLRYYGNFCSCFLKWLKSKLNPKKGVVLVDLNE